jgi:poly(3-hydroxybutyrate) depolymerase
MYGFFPQDQTYNDWIGNLGDSCSPLSVSCWEKSSRHGVRTRASAEDTEVVFYKLIGATHTWYSSPLNVAGQLPYNPNLNSSTGIVTDDVLWNFFSSHAKP